MHQRSTIVFMFSSYTELFPHQVGALVPFTSVDDHTYDYIIVGGGTAGCVLASRLSEDPSVSVLVLERGRIDDSWVNRVPLISSNAYREGAPACRWDSLPVKAVGPPREIVRGQGLGGGSRINAMVVTRGAPGDYNHWRDLGHPEWSYDKLQPYFNKSETALSREPSKYRGFSGPWVNRTFPARTNGPLSVIQKAAQAIGIPHVPDVNYPHASAIGCGDLDIATTKSGHRVSTLSAFLPPALVKSRKANLKLCTNAVISRIDFDRSGKTPQATGVYFQQLAPVDEKLYYARARREVIVCAGATGSPQVLLLRYVRTQQINLMGSGIGPKEHLDQHGIKQTVELPGVGENLLDHAAVAVMYKVPFKDSLHYYANSIIAILLALIQYLFSGSGILDFGFIRVSIFVRSALMNSRCEFVDVDPKDLDATPAAHVPDVELMPLLSAVGPGTSYDAIKFGVFSLFCAILQPKSKGTVRLTSTDPRGLPAVDLGFLDHLDDWVPARRAIRLALRLGNEMREQGYALEDHDVPRSDSEQDLDDFIRRNVRTTYHYTSTCRMAKRDEGGVVDDELRVHGVNGLRVCDTSIFPDIPATHTMAPAVVVAEKCADMIKASWQ